MERTRIALTLAVFLAGSTVAPLGAQDAPPEPEPDPTAEKPDSPEAPAEDGTPPEPEEKPAPELDIPAAIEQLNDENFHIREEAQLSLWEAGEEAEKALEKAAEDGPLETRMRALRILDLFRFGIYPGTPKETIALIRQFRRGTEEEQQIAVRALSDLGEFELLARLLGTVTDKDMRLQLSQALVAGAERNARKHILAEEYDKAEEALRLSAVSHNGMASYASFLLHTGKLEKKLGDLAGVNKRDTVALELRHWLERTSGRFDEALKTAELLKDRELTRETRIAMGDLAAYANHAADPSLRTVKSIGMKAAAARLSGDAAAFDMAIGQLEAYPEDHPNEIYDAYIALMINGETEKGIALVETADANRMFERRTQQRRFEHAFKSIGIDEFKPPFDKWLDAFLAEFPAIEDISKARDELYRFNQVVTFCVKYGEKEVARALCAKAAPVIGNSKHGFRDTLINALRFWDFRELGYEETGKALEKGMAMEDVLDIYFSNRLDDVGLWTELLAEELKNDPVASLRALDQLVFPEESGKLSPEAQALLERGEKQAEKVEAAPADGDDDDDREDFGVQTWHKALASVYEAHERWEDAKRHWKRSGRLDSHWQTLVRIGNICVVQEKYAEAAEWYRKAWDINHRNEINLHLHGWALARSGREEEGEKAMRKAVLLMLGDTSKLGELSRRLIRGGDAERSLPLARYVIAIASPYGFESALASETLGEYLVYTEHAGEAAVFLERRLLDLMNRGARVDSTILQYMVWIASAKARDAFSKGNLEEALAHARKAMGYIPGDSSILEELYPLMADGGAAEQAGKLFDDVYAKSKEEVTLYPGYGQGNNNHAWLLSRCRRNLDEALAHAEKAVAIRPKSAASIDTLAEVHYARGEFRKAVEVSDKAVSLAPNDVQLQRQNARFHAAAKKAVSDS